MKIIVLHGDDTVKSYERLKKFIETARGRNWEIMNLDETETNLEENLSTPSLFGSDRFFILRDIHRLGKREFTWLNQKYAEISGTLIIYHEGDIGKLILKNLPREIKVEEYKPPKIIWVFLDHLYPGNSKVALKEFHQVITREAPEFVFSLIAKQFRDLYWIKIAPKTLEYPSWRTSKLRRQSEKFTSEQLKGIINFLSEADIEIKSSKVEPTATLDLMILKQLE